MIYFLVFILLLLLSFRYDINGKTRGRDHWYLAMLVVLILVAGLRFRTTGDTMAYLYHFYHDYSDLEHLNLTRLTRHEPFWVYLNSLVKTFGGRFYVVQIIQASIVNIIIFRFFKKYSSYPFLCVFFYYILAYHYFTMIVMRNAVAIVICLLANDYVLERKWKKAYLLYFIAVMFHYSSALFIIITPCLLFLRLNKLGLLFLASMLVVGNVLQSYFEDLFALLEFNAVVSNKLDAYMESGGFSTEGNNLNYYVFQLIMPVFYIGLSLYHVKKDDPQSDLLKMEPFVMIGLMFMMLRFNIGMLHRFSVAYEVYFILFIVQFFMNMYKTKKVLSNAVSLARTIVVFSPFLLFSIYTSIISDRYSPYHTVIDKKIEIKRENSFINTRGAESLPKKNEY